MAVHLPLGFRFAGLHAGIKKNAQKEDLTLVHCPTGAVAAGVYTTNLVYAAPVAFDRQRTPSPVQALALPELTMTTRMSGEGVRWRSKATGAADPRFVG